MVPIKEGDKTLRKAAALTSLFLIKKLLVHCYKLHVVLVLTLYMLLLILNSLPATMTVYMSKQLSV